MFVSVCKPAIVALLKNVLVEHCVLVNAEGPEKDAKHTKQLAILEIAQLKLIVVQGQIAVNLVDQSRLHRLRREPATHSERSERPALSPKTPAS